MKTLIKILLFSFIVLTVNEAWATTYYARENGGCPKTSSGPTDPGCANICNGTVNVDYSVGVTPNCAYNHPDWALPMFSQDTTYKMSGGDELVIVNGTYRMGCKAGGDCRDPQYNTTDSGGCDADYSYDCKGNPIPDGSSGNPTLITGCSLTGCGCTKTGDSYSCTSTPPILWSAGRSNQMFSVDGSDYVTFKDIEITDHADGTESIESVCSTGDATRLSGLYGIYGNSGSNLIFDGLRAHGFCQYGLRLGGIDNISFLNSTITRNGWSGWSLDSCAGAGTCGVTGDVILTNNTITWNGCTEDYPSIGLKTAGCHGQADNIIADGIESSDSGGDWVLTGNNISWNTHDGPDLLYVNKGAYSGGSVVYRRNRLEGNGGNAMKGPNALIAEDNFIAGNCGFFSDQSFTSATWSNTSDSCRGQGNAIEIAFRDATTVPKIISNTIISNGDVVVDTSGSCTSGTDIIFANNQVLGGRQFADDTHYNGAGGNDTVSIFYNSCPYSCTVNSECCSNSCVSNVCTSSCNADFIESDNVCYGLKEGSSACNGTGSTDTVANPFVSAPPMGPWSGAGYYTGTNMIAGVYLTSATNDADETVSGADSVDYNNYDRGASWDIGAIEYGSTPSEPTCGDTCSVCSDQTTCEASAATCYWYSSTCNSTPQPASVPTGVWRGTWRGVLR